MAATVYFFPPVLEKEGKRKVIFFLYGINVVCGCLCKFCWERSHFVLQQQKKETNFFASENTYPKEDFKAIILQLMKAQNKYQQKAEERIQQQQQFFLQFHKEQEEKQRQQQQMSEEKLLLQQKEQEEKLLQQQKEHQI